MKDSPLRRLLHNAYEDGIYTPRGGYSKSVRRLIRRRRLIVIVKYSPMAPKT